MQHKNVWMSTKGMTQTKLKRLKDNDIDDTGESSNLSDQKKFKIATMLDFSRRSASVSQSKEDFSFYH